MFSLRKRKEAENLITVERKQVSPQIENSLEIYIENMDDDISKIIYQRLMENYHHL
jgi:predicted transglutaminase-like protease